jgi:ribonuclease BN (tRNA processing enzyme)
MRVTFCGTAGGPFTEARSSSGLIVQADGRMVMLDCGPGSVQGAMRAGIALPDLGAIILSHLHSDHVLDLAAFPFLDSFGVAPVPPVYGPPGTAALIAAVSGYHAAIVAAGASPLPDPPPARPLAAADATEIAGSDERAIAGFTVRSAETPHAPNVVAAVRRLTADGTTVVYTGDTQPNPATIVPLATGADLLVHEAYNEAWLQRAVAAMPSGRGERIYAAMTASHTEVRQAAAIARDAGVRRLVLTHLIMGRDDADALARGAAEIFDGEVTVASDGLAIDL